MCGIILVGFENFHKLFVESILVFKIVTQLVLCSTGLITGVLRT